jgi:hypothetical protein
MIRAESGEIDGIDAASLRPGVIYDLPASLGTYLILNATAEPVELRAIDPDEERIAVNVQAWREVAANGTAERRKGPNRSPRDKSK